MAGRYSFVGLGIADDGSYAVRVLVDDGIGGTDDAAATRDKDFAPISDFRASSSYRRRVAANLVRRVFVESDKPETPTDVMAL